MGIERNRHLGVWIKKGAMIGVREKKIKYDAQVFRLVKFIHIYAIP